MSSKLVVMIAALAALALGAVACCDKEADPQVEELKARVAALEKANTALEKQAQEAKPAAAAGDCAARLAACEERAAKCEKDPFTGVKYLADQPGEKAAQ
jgi:hypothetical protein